MESSKDTLTAIHQTTDDKGKVRKTIYKYTVKDTLILAQKFYDANDKLKMAYTYDRSYSKMKSYSVYRRGKLKWSMDTEYENGKLKRTIWKKRSKVTSTEEMNYDAEGRLVEIDKIGKEKKRTRTTKITYQKR